MPDLVPATSVRHSTPVPQHFSREAQAEFLDLLSQWGNVRAAARHARVSRNTAYRMRRACPRFRTLWDAALIVARPQVEEVLADRALNGVEEQVFYHGEEVATRRRYDGRLLLAHLARLDRLIRDGATEEAARDFEDTLEELLGEPEIEFVDLVTGEPLNSPQDSVSSVSSEPHMRQDEAEEASGASLDQTSEPCSIRSPESK